MHALYENSSSYSPTEEVSVIILKPDIRVAKYTLCDVACIALLIALHVQILRLLAPHFQIYFFVLSCPNDSGYNIAQWLA